MKISQVFIRQVDGDPSASSLRDVRRCLRLIEWFREKVVPHKKETKISALACATTLGLAFTYYYRLSKQSDRTRLVISRLVSSLLMRNGSFPNTINACVCVCEKDTGTRCASTRDGCVMARARLALSVWSGPTASRR